ncbi:hypothetical protein [Herbiconiux sp.]|uniref:hypothetical protein n=1 Tax=Herbiconiux sp. TaxID=1871186 RepID=UPI0025C00DCE|nr:hypothetical protein [Herbiconiux sp.]
MSEESDEQGQQPVVSRGAGIRVRGVDLGARSLIGSGAATEVHRLEAFTVPGHPGGLALVNIRDTNATHWDSAALSRLVALRWALDARERALLDGLAAWPLAVVEGEDGDVVGCLVPLAAHPFYYLPAEEKNPGKVPQQVKGLVTAPKRARRAGAAAVGERDLVARSTVLARVCLLLDLLHRHEGVYGDLSDRSVLFGVGDVAEAFVVGCEGAVVGQAAADEPVPQRNSAGWAAPETFENADADDPKTEPSMSRAPSLQTAATDRYKLALLILRVLAPAGDGLERSRDADRIRSVLDETGQRMMRDALEGDPDARPGAADWYQYLRGVIVESLTAPSIRSVVVSPALVAEGDELRLEVELSGARQLTIEMPGRADITREVGGRIVTERFTARQTGRIRVRATNAHGEDVALTDQVRVLPVPTPARIAIATLEVPAELGVLPDLASLEAALGISTPPSSAAADSPDGAASVSPFDRVADLRARLDADALPLRDVLQIGLEAERVSRERDRLFPSFEAFLGEITSRKGAKQPDA